MTLKELLGKFQFVSKHGCGAKKLIEVVRKQIGDVAEFETSKGSGYDALFKSWYDIIKYCYKKSNGNATVEYEFEENYSRLRGGYKFKINVTWSSDESVCIFCDTPLLEFWHFNIKVNRCVDGVSDDLWYTIPLEDGNIRIDYCQRAGHLGYVSLEDLLNAIENEEWDKIYYGFKPNKLAKERVKP